MSDDWENIGEFKSNVTSKVHRYSTTKYYAEKNFRDVREGMTNLNDGTYLVCSDCLREGIIEIHKNRIQAVMHQIGSHDFLTNNDMGTMEVTSNGLVDKYGAGLLYENVQKILDKKKMPIDTMRIDEGELAAIYIRDQIESDL
jgi:hypothetical protein